MSKLTFAIRSLVPPAALVGIACAAAGRLDLPFVWTIAGVIAAFHLLMAVFVDLTLLNERQAPASGNMDRLTRPLGVALVLIHWILAGLDVGRLHWSVVPWPVQAAGVAGFVAALAVNFWAMRVNRFYSSVVRIQPDRGHHPIVDGPYRFVRHPGYAATLCAIFTGGIALGSWLAMIPALGFAALFIRRTLLEDRMLQQELAGYAEYAQRVKYRLVPGIF